jgi:uncharacterized protein
MKYNFLITYFAILVILCIGFILGARLMGEQGMYLAGGYMLTPALAALLTRIFFHPQHFKDAGLRFGKFGDYIKFWLASLGITALSYILFTLFGSIRWDFSGQVFLDLLAQQFAATGQDMMATLPPGFTPQMMLWLFVVGGLTVFNILPGIISGFGEEFGHRGMMFTNLLPDKPVFGLLLGGFLWYLWHLPLILITPPGPAMPAWQTVVNFIVTAIGSICTHTYLCYIYAKSRSIFIPSIAHITLNNAARSFAYFVVIQNQFAANLALNLTMVLVVAFLFYRKELRVIPDFLSEKSA